MPVECETLKTFKICKMCKHLNCPQEKDCFLMLPLKVEAIEKQNLHICLYHKQDEQTHSKLSSGSYHPKQMIDIVVMKRALTDQ